MSADDDSLAGDLLWGAAAIADYIGRPRRVVFHLLETSALPARKVGGRWVASRARLRAVLSGEEG